MGSELNRHFEEDSRARARPMTQGNFMSWTGTCVKCGMMRRAGHGLFFSNFLLGRATFPPCRNVWYGECYREASDNCFPRLDDNGEGQNATDLEIEVSTMLNRYCCERNGDHLMGVPFECDLCSFRNVCGRDPVFGNYRDQFTLTSICRVQLDVMWARESHTVATNWARAKADYEMAMRQLSVLPERLLPRLGSKEVRERVGMSEALVTFPTSLRYGRNSKHIQYDTMKKMRTWLNNAHDAEQEYSCETVVGLDRARQYVTTGHTLGKWFGRFMRGSRMRMGMIRRQNEALTLALVMVVCAEAETRWHLPIGDNAREELEDTVVFMLATFGAGLQGEEVPLISLD
jgi:hypothetical protein